MDIDMNEDVFDMDTFVSGVGEAVAYGSCVAGSSGVVNIEEGSVSSVKKDEKDSDVLHPALGMEFDSIEDALYWYKGYAVRLGFGAVKRSNHMKQGMLYHYAFACSKWKDPKLDEKDDKPVIGKRKRPVVACKCQASIAIGDTGLEGRWVIKRVVLEHNHELVPNLAKRISTNRKIPLRFKKELEFNDDEGIATHQNIDMVISHAGEYGKCTFSRKDARNHIDKHRKERMKPLLGNDALVLMDYFNKKKTVDPNFWYSYSFTKQDRLNNIFWADGRGRASYKYFREFLVVDSTYLTNRYDMPLVLFVGVNHYEQSILFGCALVGKEDDNSYKWVFSKFLECMGDVKPGAILTDQCKSIENGIKFVFPGVVHRFCAWHITQKVPMKLGGAAYKDGISFLVNYVVYESLTPDEFEAKWKKLMVEIGYDGDPWFESLFGIRRKWVPAYLNDRFWAGMTTTQRAESMNSFLRKYVRKRCTLGLFVVQFENALKRLFERENEADLDSSIKKPDLVSEGNIEKQFLGFYSNKMFCRFQRQVLCRLDLHCEFCRMDGNFKVYSVYDSPYNRIFEVKFDEESKEVFCVCKMFESVGILCRHCLEVLKVEKVSKVGRRYILDRWRKDFKRANLTIPNFENEESPYETRYSLLYRKVNPILEEILDFGSLNEKTVDEVVHGVVDLRNKLFGLTENVEVPEEVGRGRGRGRGAWWSNG